MPKNKLFIYYTAIFVLMISACQTSRFNVVKADKDAMPSGKQGIFYNLARTEFDIEVSVTKIEKIKGPFAEFAGKYLGLTNVINQNSTQYQLNEITINPVAVPDPNQFYFIETGNKNQKDVPELLLSLSNAGLILNTKGEETTTQPFRNFIPASEEDNIFPDVFKYFSDLNLFEQVDTIIERVNLDTTTIEKMILKRTLVEKTPEQKAKDAADFIMKVKESRLNLISGYQEVNYDKETFILMNQELEKLETEYQKLFTGLTFTKTLNYHYTYKPLEEKPCDSVVLFRFSGLRGILDTSNMNGTAVIFKIQASGHTWEVKDYLSKVRQDKIKTRGYFYRIPEYAGITLSLGERNLISGKFLVNQFGVVTHLPARNAEIRFFPETSGINTLHFSE